MSNISVIPAKHVLSDAAGGVEGAGTSAGRSAPASSSPLVGEAGWGVRGAAARRPRAGTLQSFRALLPSARKLTGERVAAKVSAAPHRPAPGARSLPRLFAILTPAILLAACAAHQTPAAVAPQAPGFLLGVWHGFIFPVAWVLSLFMPDVSIYAVPNNGGWYDFGYFIGIVFLGVGARSAKVRRR
jgi:hypothetical protein